MSDEWRTILSIEVAAFIAAMIAALVMTARALHRSAQANLTQSKTIEAMGGTISLMNDELRKHGEQRESWELQRCALEARISRVEAEATEREKRLRAEAIEREENLARQIAQLKGALSKEQRERESEQHKREMLSVKVETLERQLEEKNLLISELQTALNSKVDKSNHQLRHEEQAHGTDSGAVDADRDRSGDAADHPGDAGGQSLA